MGGLLKLIAQTVWPARANSAGAPREAYLKFLVIVMIALTAGPDAFAVMELTTLLELLGAALFLLTVGVGLQALGLSSALHTLRKFLLPTEYVALIRSEKPSAVFHGVSLVCRKLLIFCAVGLVAYAWISDLARLAS